MADERDTATVSRLLASAGKKKIVYLCPCCGTEFKNKLDDDMYIHLTQEHDKGYLALAIIDMSRGVKVPA